MTFGGPMSGNAPIKNAARTPSSKPKIILRAFGRMITPRPLSASGGKSRREAASEHCRHPSSDRINNVTLAQM
jgi:hypothetical protein